MTITEAIGRRYSVRNYDGRPLDGDALARLSEDIKDAVAPFGGRWSARIVSVAAGDFRPSTYGIIRGARDYMAVGMADDSLSRMAGGYCMEEVVLKAWQRGLGTCWLGGTFRASTFGRRHDELPLTAVIPVGHPAKSGLVNKIARTMARSDRRRPMQQLFFTVSSVDADKPLAADSHLYKPLELMRLAPSSTNCQPWRAVVNGHCVHFFNTGTRAMCDIDMGIGLRHFVYGCAAYNVTGHFETTGPARNPAHARYVISYITD